MIFVFKMASRTNGLLAANHLLGICLPNQTTLKFWKYGLISKDLSDHQSILLQHLIHILRSHHNIWYLKTALSRIKLLYHLSIEFFYSYDFKFHIKFSDKHIHINIYKIFLNLKLSQWAGEYSNILCRNKFIMTT